MASVSQACSYSCEICGIRSSSLVDYESHIRGIRHWTEVRKLVRDEKHPDRSPSQAQKKYCCKVCKVSFSSASWYDRHLSTKHPRTSRNEASQNCNKSVIMPCRLCNMEMSGPISFKQHVQGRYHRTVVQQLLSKQNEGQPCDASQKSMWRPGHFPGMIRPPAYRYPGPRDPYHYFRGMNQTWAPGYFPRIRGPSPQYYAAQPCVSVTRRHSSDNSCTGLFHCGLCDTYHRSSYHYQQHRASEHPQ